MSSTQVRSETAIETPRARTVDMKLEVVVIPVSDVDRAKRFYSNLGWRLDADFAAGDEFRARDQFTPPGSSCSIHLRHGNHVGRAWLGTGTVSRRLRHQGSARRAASIAVSTSAKCSTRARRGTSPTCSAARRIRTRRSYHSYATFSDPDGNGWLLQEVTVRLPGRVDADDTTFTSSTELATALRRAATAHGEHEKRTGQHDADWPDWYAEYIVREQAGKELPS